ncbi:MAG: serine hydrolase domain-containing protein [Gemmatimonadaceae bacterium]
MDEINQFIGTAVRRCGVLRAILVTLAVSACAHSPAEQDDPVRQVEMVHRYVDAFNTGEPAALAAVLERMYSAVFLAAIGGADAAAWERLELRRTYGPLAHEYVDTLARPPIVWTRGTVSRGWVGHQLYLSDGPDSKVTRHSIWRPRPVAYPDLSLGESQVAESMRIYLQELSDADHFSGSVTISHQGRPVLDGSWGLDGQSAPRPITPDTRFHIASVTKLLTITALLQLAEAGVVTLDDPIGRWIPEYPQPYRDSVRIRHLLTHTSGIELDDDAEYLAKIRVARTAADLLQAQVQHIANRKPPFPPGSEYDYTSEGIDLLGVIIERATDRPWTDNVRERVLQPAGMHRTRFTVPADEGGWALGKTSLNADLQTTTPGALRPALEILPVVAKPSSGIWSTADDLHRYMRALLDYRLLGPAWTDSLLTPHRQTGELPKYGIRSWVGLGVQGEDLWGIRTLGHGGVVPGYSAAIEYVPDNGWLLAVVSNTGEATGFLVFQRFLELVATGGS